MLSDAQAYPSNYGIQVRIFFALDLTWRLASRPCKHLMDNLIVQGYLKVIRLSRRDIVMHIAFVLDLATFR